ncbi:hypothetical protein QAO70_001012 [Enterococcus faecium]|nr:hypothetical protein [Enterococcus faecium]EME3497064.1 hypothetical protein [Enterococcus faecium]EME7102908.1 hypothetical protein [Enterococcus faecium]HCD4270286.1 hypothetical protein [Enterococcus faecium]
MKKLIVLFILSAGLLTLTGCDLFGGSDQSSDETTDSSVLRAEKADITNSVYTLKVRKDMDLSAGQLTFTDKKMEWTRTYQTQGADSSESSEKKTVLTDIKITTKDDEYIISGKENKKEATVTFTKIGNYRLKDKDGNIYSL